MSLFFLVGAAGTTEAPGMAKIAVAGEVGSIKNAEGETESSSRQGEAENERTIRALETGEILLSHASAREPL